MRLTENRFSLSLFSHSTYRPHSSISPDPNLDGIESNEMYSFVRSARIRFVHLKHNQIIDCVEYENGHGAHTFCAGRRQ